MPLTILLNPSAGRGRGARLRELLETTARHHGAGLVVTESADHLRHEARRAVAAGAERLVVAGGDGTFHHALQEVAETDCALGLVPVGTGNDLAGTLELPTTTRSAVEAALTGASTAMDLGRVGDRWFAVYAGIGLDGEVAQRVNEARWRLPGRGAYAIATVQAVLGYTPPTLEIRSSELQTRGQYWMVIAANGPRVGGGMKIAPQADLNDGRLDLVAVARSSRRRLLRLFPRVFRGTHLAIPEVSHRLTEEVSIAADRLATVFADGEPVQALLPAPDGTAVTVRSVPGALQVVVPRA